MRSSRWTPVAGWCAATASSIVLASVAILPVLRTAAPQDSALSQLPAAQASEFPASVPSSAGAVTPTGAPSRPRPRPSRSTPSSTPTTATTTSAPPVRPTRTTAPPTTTEDGWTVTTGANGVRTFVRSFRVAGGQAVIRMTSRGVVALVTATPAEGYAVQKVQNTPDNMAVYFNETNHSFIIHAAWWDDRPFTEVSEIGK